MALKFEGCFEVSQRVRVYDYDPKFVDGEEVYFEGVVDSIVLAPVKAYMVDCDKCTGSFREGVCIFVPMELTSNEFDSRIIAA